MNERITEHHQPAHAAAVGNAWPEGHRLGCFELQAVVASRSAGVVYRGWDHELLLPVAVKEYLPTRLARRHPGGRVEAAELDTAADFERGRQAFIGESRTLAHVEHPSLLRVLHQLQAHGTVYRVMPWYVGSTLLELRREMAGPPDEATLRALLDDLLGALEAYHRVGGVHGGLNPAQIMLLENDRVLLLGPGAARLATASDSVESLMRQLEPTFAAPEQTTPMPALPRGPWTDFYALAEVARFCITGLLPAPAGGARPEPLAATIERLFFDRPSVHYGANLLQALDAAASPDTAERPQSVTQFREWLGRQPHDPSADDETASLIQRVIESIPPAPPRPSPPPGPPAAASEAPDEAPDEALAWQAQPAFLAPPRKRSRSRLWAGVAVLLLGLAGYGTWLWQRPTLRADQLAALPAEAATPAAPLAPPVASTQDVTPPPAQVTVPPPAQVTVPPPVADAVPPPSPSPSPSPSPHAAETIEPAAPAVAPAPAPRVKTLAPRVHAPPVRTPAVHAAAAHAPVVAGAKPAGSPRETCGARADFALYRCMQQQCELEQWLHHPQCVHLKATDQVD